jgi:hypothetical protein
MKTLTTNLMIAAAALTVLAAGASAQSLKAEIPFTFRAGNATLLPGAYRVDVTTSAGGQYVTLRGLDHKAAVILTNFSADLSPKAGADGHPMLGFECAGHTCVLRNLWRGYYTPAYRFYGPTLRGDDVRLTHVALAPTRTD